MNQLQKVSMVLDVVAQYETATIEAHSGMIVCYVDGMREDTLSKKQTDILRGCGWEWDTTNEWWYYMIV